MSSPNIYGPATLNIDWKLTATGLLILIGLKGFWYLWVVPWKVLCGGHRCHTAAMLQLFGGPLLGVQLHGYGLKPPLNRDG